VADDAEQTVARVHVRQTEADVRTDQSVRRRADEGRARATGGGVRRPDGRAGRAGQLFDGRDRYVRVRSAIERRERRRLRVPQVRQDDIQTVVADTAEGIVFDGRAGAVANRQAEGLPVGRGRVFPVGVSRDDRVPGTAPGRSEKRFRPNFNASERRLGVGRKRTADG